LENDADYRRSLYCPESGPDTFRRFDSWPEFHYLKAAMPGYVPGANT